MKKITLKLINDERKNKRILSAKACAGYYYDRSCSGGAQDVCISEDLYQCENYAYDYCKYIDQDICSGMQTRDICEWDYSDGTCSGNDYCYTDTE